MSTDRLMTLHHGRSRHSGLGIMELMIAMAIGTFLIAGAISIYLKARDVRAALDTSARLQETARYALATIEADIRMAGFWGLTSRGEAITASASLTFPAKCGGTEWVTQTLRHVDGANNAYLALPNCAAANGGAMPGTDVLVLRRASAERISPQQQTINAADRDRVLVITSHVDGQIFVPADIGNQIPAGYATSDVAGRPPEADTRALLVNAYYVSNGSSLSPGYPALRRKSLVAGPNISDQEVIAGVEDLQFQVGLDTDGDLDADLFENPGAFTPGAKPVSVRVWLRVRAEQPDPSLGAQTIEAGADRPSSIATDHHRRLMLSGTFRLRNVSS
jgi:type IV pilus assembly protein PilW